MSCGCCFMIFRSTFESNATELYIFFCLFDVKRIVVHVSQIYWFCTFISRRIFPVIFYSIIKAKGLCSQKWIIFVKVEHWYRANNKAFLWHCCRRDLFHVAARTSIKQHQYHYWHWYSMICMKLNLKIWFKFFFARYYG